MAMHFCLARRCSGIETLSLAKWREACQDSDSGSNRRIDANRATESTGDLTTSLPGMDVEG